MNTVVKAGGGKRVPAVALFLAAAAAAAILLLGPGFTGFAAFGSMQYTDQLGLNLTGNSTAYVSLSDNPMSLRLSGYVLGGGDVELYVTVGGERLLVLNGSVLEEVDPDLDENISDIVSLINSTAGVSDEISTTLDYASGSRWDPDDDGRETPYSAIDFTVEDTVFNADLDEENLCTIWEVYSVYSGNLTTVCHGSEGCCIIYGLSPVSGSTWDENFYLPHGRYSTSSKNVVGAKVVYVDFTESGDTGYLIYRGGWDFLPAFFYLPKYSFTRACIDSCSIPAIPLDIRLDAYVGLNTLLHIEEVDYLGLGRGSVNYPSADIGGLVVSVLDSRGNPLGHSRITGLGGSVRLLLSSAPQKATAEYTVEGADTLPAPAYGTEYSEGLSSSTSAAKAVVHGLRDTPGTITARFGPVNESIVSTWAFTLTRGLTFDNMTVTLPKSADVTAVGVCQDFDFTSFTCDTWNPLSIDYADGGANVTFTVYESGVYAGLNISLLDYFLETGDAVPAGPVEVGKDITWAMPISARYDESIQFTVAIAAPSYAEDVYILEDGGERLELIRVPSEEGVQRFETSFQGGRNYTMYYTTPGLVKDEEVVSDSESYWVKSVSVRSVTAQENVALYSSVVNASRNRIRLYEVRDRLLYDVSRSPLYNFTLEDVDSDGGVDWVRWRMPRPGNHTYRIVVDRRPSLGNATGRFTRSYVNPDGTVTSEISMQPLNYLVNGSWREYDTHILRQRDGEYDYSVAEVDHQTYFSSTSLGPLRFGVGRGYVLSTPADAYEVPALASGDTIAYYGIWNASDLLYTVGPRKLKEKITLHNMSAPTRFTFRLALTGLTLREDRGGYGLYDREDNRVFGFTPPYAYDSRGRRNPVDDELVSTGRNYAYTLTLDDEFMASASYPITIDPTWSVGEGNITLDGDTDSSTIFPDALTLAVGNSSGVYRAFIDFNVSTIPDDATVSSAVVEAYVESPMVSCADCACTAYPMGESGSHYSDASDATGLWEDAGNGTLYASNGTCDVEGYKSLDLGSEGASDLQSSLPSDLFTVGLGSANESQESDYAAFTSSEGTEGQQPRLTVDWSTVTTTTLPHFYADSFEDVESRCPYNGSRREYVCGAEDVTVNGTVLLLVDGENASRNIVFNVTNNFSVSSGAVLNASGRDLNWSGSSSLPRPDGGYVGVESGYAFIYGGVDTGGGDYGSDTFTIDAGYGGNITLYVNESVYAETLLASGGSVDTLQSEGGSGGRGGSVNITSLNSWVHVGQLNADAGDSNNDVGLGGGSVTVYAADYANVSVSAAGGYSQYGGGGPGGSLTVNASGILLGCVNVSGGLGDLGAGGMGGTVTLDSSGNIGVSCGVEGYSGMSDKSVNERGGNATLRAHTGWFNLSASLLFYGGGDVDDGTGGDGGTLAIEAYNVSLSNTLNVTGGGSSAGSGGDGGSVTVGYCSVLDNGSASYDVSGGSGPGSDGLNGSVTTTEAPSWCNVTTTTLPQTPPYVTLNSPSNGTADTPTYRILNATVDDVNGDPVDVWFYGRNQTASYGLLYNDSGLSTSTSAATLTYNWTNLSETTYHWFVNASDEYGGNESEAWIFTVGEEMAGGAGGPPPTAPYATLDHPPDLDLNESAWRILNATLTDINNDTLEAWVYVGNSSGDLRLVYHNNTLLNTSLVEYNVTALPVAGSESLSSAVGYVDPDGDGSTVTWDCAGPSCPTTYNYVQVNDSVRQPSAPDTTEYLTGLSDDIDEYDMETISGVESVSQIMVWVYGKSDQEWDDYDLELNIYVDGSWQTAENVNLTTSYQWLNATFTGSWDQTDLDNLQVRVQYTGPWEASVAAVYAEITYEVQSVKGDSPVLILHLDNNSDYGENDSWAYDFSGYDNNGTFKGSGEPDAGSGKFAGAVDFDGVDDYVDCGNAALLYDLDDFTVAAWIKANVSGNYHTIVSTRHALGSGVIDKNYDFALRFGRVSIQKSSDTNWIQGTNVVPDDKWVHVAVTWNGSDGGGTAVRVYLNGALEGNDTRGGSLDWSSTYHLTVGSNPSTDPYRDFFNGSIDEVAVWNRTLSATEVLDLYRLRNGSYYWSVNVSDGSFSNLSEERMFTVGEIPGNIAPTFGYWLIQPAEVNSSDAHIKNNTDVNYPNTRSLFVGRQGDEYWRSLMRFNVSDIPSDGNITYSYVSMYLWNTTYSITDSMYNVTSLWDESAVTWTARTGSESWTTPGGDYE